MRKLITTGVVSILAVCAIHADSVIEINDGRASVKPAAKIEAGSLNESSGLEHWRGAWWSHNDSGGAPVLYRAERPDFKDARILEVPGAKNVDWEELTTLGDDLIVCDIGNSRHDRDDLKLYRLGWDAENAQLKRIAVYPISYRGGSHDAEAAFELDGRLHLVARNREGVTAVHRFNDLVEGENNVAERLGELDIDKRVQITAADTGDDEVVLLSYSHLLIYDNDKLTGKPARALRLHAGRCKSLALQDGELVYGNEQQDIYRVENFLERDITALLPPPVSIELPFRETVYEPDGSGEDWKADAFELELDNMRDGEYLRWMISGAWLMLAGKFDYESFASSRTAGSRLGTGLMLMFSRDGDDFVGERDVHLWLGDNGATGVDAWALDTEKNLKLEPAKGFKVEGGVESGTWYFEYAFPLPGIFGVGRLPDEFQFNVWGYNLHGEKEPRLAGRNIFCFQYPFTWAEATIRYPED